MQGPTVFQSGVLRRTSIHCSKVAGTLLDMSPRQGAYGNRFIRCALIITYSNFLSGTYNWCLGFKCFPTL